MDIPLVSFELKEKYLLVLGLGKRDNFAEMAKASSAIYEKVIETKSKALLVDYRKLEINLSLTQAFNVVRKYEANMPELADVAIACVFNEDGLEFGNYWKDIAQKRGFNIVIFKDFESAEDWLLRE